MTVGNGTGRVHSTSNPSHTGLSPRVRKKSRKVSRFMSWQRKLALQLAVVAMVSAMAGNAAAQSTLGNITGRATDSSGGALPGVTVSITSTNLIGGARTAVTDEQGLYRFTLLPGGIYTVKFELPGFTTMNIEGVDLNAGATMTINGKLDVASLQETVTVTSQAPTIDLEAANVAVNWDQQKLDDIPYSRSLTGLVALIPGLYATAYDVGGSNFGTGSGPAARTFGRAGGNVVSYDGMIWDQTYGDFGTYEEAQITTAAKGADAIIMTAAVADYRPAHVADEKLKRGALGPKTSLNLVANPDLLAELGKSRKGKTPLLVGFAAETEDVINNAFKKLESKRVDLIVANDVSEPNSGFAVDTNHVQLVDGSGEVIDVPPAPKAEVAHRILDKISELLGSSTTKQVTPRFAAARAAAKAKKPKRK